MCSQIPDRAHLEVIVSEGQVAKSGLGRIRCRLPVHRLRGLVIELNHRLAVEMTLSVLRKNGEQQKSTTSADVSLNVACRTSRASRTIERIGVLGECRRSQKDDENGSSRKSN